MDSLNQNAFVRDLRTNLDKSLANPWVLAIVVITLTVFSAYTAPSSKEATSFLQSTVGRLAVFTVLAFLANRNLMASLITAVAYFYALRYFNKESFQQGFANQVGPGIPQHVPNTVNYQVAPYLYSGKFTKPGSPGVSDENLEQWAKFPNPGNNTCTPGLLGTYLCDKSLGYAYDPDTEYAYIPNAFPQGPGGCGSTPTKSAAPVKENFTATAAPSKGKGTAAPKTAAPKTAAPKTAAPSVQKSAVMCSSQPHYNAPIDHTISDPWNCPYKNFDPASSLSTSICASGGEGGPQYQPVKFGPNSKASNKLVQNISPGAAYTRKEHTKALCPWNDTSNSVGLTCKQ